MVILRTFFLDFTLFRNIIPVLILVLLQYTWRTAAHTDQGVNHRFFDF